MQRLWDGFTSVARRRYHGPRPVNRPNHVWVSNHTSMIDYIILTAYSPFAVIMQLHPGWVGFLQTKVLNCLGCLWFNRTEVSLLPSAAVAEATLSCLTRASHSGPLTHESPEGHGHPYDLARLLPGLAHELPKGFATRASWPHPSGRPATQEGYFLVRYAVPGGKARPTCVPQCTATKTPVAVCVMRESPARLSSSGSIARCWELDVGRPCHCCTRVPARPAASPPLPAVFTAETQSLWQKVLPTGRTLGRTPSTLLLKPGKLAIDIATSCTFAGGCEACKRSG